MSPHEKATGRSGGPRIGKPRWRAQIGPLGWDLPSCDGSARHNWRRRHMAPALLEEGDAGEPFDCRNAVKKSS
jgi:hypothetical protein